MTRRELREQIFLVLFSLGFHEGEDPRDLVIRYLDETCEKKVSDFERAEILKKALEIIEKKEELDKAIDSVSQGWRIDRMGKAELNLLRLALYEMRYLDDVPVKVAINEAVDLSKEYGDDDAPSFVNGILAKLA
ncbi:MAG: transcription antitermination factor NusB [Eubacteriales bacterium]|nr:transcription antitermination factor NusB [Eubacteriales bacterium]